MNMSKVWLVICLAVAAFGLVLPGGGGAVRPLTVYGNLPGFERAAISASGDRVAAIGVVQDQRRLIVMDADGKPILTAPLGDVKIRGLHWAGDNMVLVEISVTAGLDRGFTVNKAELWSMLVVPVNSGKPWLVFGNVPRVTGGISGFYGVTEQNGNWYGYFGGITLETEGGGSTYLRTTSPVLYKVDLQTQHIVKIAPRMELAGSRDWLIAADGSVAATLDYYSDSEKWTITNTKGQTIAAGRNAFGSVQLLSFGATPGTVLYGEESHQDRRQRWFEVPLAGGDAREALSGTDVAGALSDGRTHRLQGFGIEGDIPSYKFLDAHQQKVAAATQKAFPNLSVRIVDWNERFDRLIVMTEGVGDSQNWWLVDIKTGDARPIGCSYPMAAADVAPMKMIQYAAADGTKISAVLTLPPAAPAKNLPAVILPHGGPAARDYPGFDWWAQAFASRGYVVLQPNFRGSTGYGNAFLHAGYGEWGRKMQTDISDGLAELVKQGIVDARRVCIVGASYGGYAALAGVTLQHGLYRCAVSLAGVSDVARMAATGISERGSDATFRRAIEEEIGSGKDLKAVSPIRFADKADAPILLIHGKDDTVVHYNQSSAMVDALRGAGKTVEFVTLPGEDHWLSKSATRLTMLQAAVAFVQKYNPADPVK